MNDIIFPDDISTEISSNPQIFTKIQIHVYKRNGRKYITRIENLSSYLQEEDSLKMFLKQARRRFVCNGVVTNNQDGENVVQLQGNHRDSLRSLLIAEYNIDPNNIIERGI